MNDGLPGNIRFTIPNSMINNVRVYSTCGKYVYWCDDNGVLRKRFYRISSIQNYLFKGVWVLVKQGITPSMTIKPFKI